MSGIPLIAHGIQSMEITNEPDVPETGSSLPIVSSQTLSAPVSAQTRHTFPTEAGSTGPSRRGKSLGAIKITLDTIEAASGAIPIVGSYMGAAAKVGNIIVQMIQTMDSNEETAQDLKDHASRLSQVLDTAQEDSTQQQREKMIECMNDVQQELQSLRGKLEEIDTLSGFNKAFSSNEHAEALKVYKEKIRAALEVMQ
ncbi:hypothetical protein FRC00_004249, partial [Tulasnella sp. 408]